MAGKDPHSDGSTGSTRASNVVHLRPRQWLDADEELVPIGGATSESDNAAASSPPELTRPRDGNASAHLADELTAAEGTGHASTWLGAGEETVPITPEPAASPGTESWAAADFWGEDAASVQDALEVPVSPSPAGEPAGSPPRRFHRPRRSVSSAALAIAAAALVASAINGFGSAPATPGRSASISSLRADTTMPSTADAAAAATTAAQMRTAGAASEHRARELAQRRSRSRATVSRARTRRSHPSATPATSTPAVRSAPSAPVSAPTPVTYRSAAPTPETSASPSRAGPTGAVSLIGAGTSSSG